MLAPVSCSLGPMVVLAAAGAAPAMGVRGDTVCPTPAAVSAALAGLVKAGDRSAAPNVVELGGRGAAVDVRLRKASGELIAEKRLPEASSCDERARAAAVIVAAWEARLGAGVQPALSVPTQPPPLPARAGAPEGRPPPLTAPAPPPVPTPAPAPVPVALAAPGPALSVPPSVPPPAAAPVPVAPPAPPSPPSPAPPGAEAEVPRSRAAETGLAVRAPAVPPPGPTELEPGLAILASVAAGDVSPAVLVETTFTRRGAPFAVGVGALAVATHSMSVGSGRGAWRRFGGTLDLRSGARGPAMALELRAGVALTVLGVTGQSFPVTGGATLFDPGLVAGLRGRFRLGRLWPWAEATAAFWPRAHTLYVGGGTAGSADLPSFEALLGAGVSLGGDR